MLGEGDSGYADRMLAMKSAFTVHEVQQLGRSINSVLRVPDIQTALLALQNNPDAQLLAGGTDLLLELQRSGSGDSVAVVDVTGIAGFRDIDDAGDHWRIAGGVTHNQVVRHDALRASALPLAQACLEIGSPQLRNRATLAGNIATASPANDSISALMALNAAIEVSYLDDADTIATNNVPIREFFTGFRQTVLQPGQLISAILVPKLADGERGLWVKLGLRKAQAISVVHAGIVLELDEDGAVESVALAMGSIAPTVVMIDAIDHVVGSQLEDTAISAAAQSVAASISPITDGRATADYRRNTVVTLIERSLRALRDDAQASMWPVDPPTLSSDDELATVRVGATSFDRDDSVTIAVNGKDVSSGGATGTLLDWVRDQAGLTGMKEGCAEGECGACTMLVDGAAVMSCLVTAAQVDGHAVTTVEGLDHPIQQAFVDDFAVQCGFCIPGFLMSGARLIDECPTPSTEQIQLGLSGNLCRCTGYYPITQAVRDAAVEVRTS